MKPIADALKEYLNARGAKNQFQLARLWENWEMVMGPDLAALAFPLGQRKGILLVGAEDNLAAQDLSYMSPEILERVNAFMDGPFFNRVEVHLLFGRTPLDTTRVVVPPSSRVPLPPRPEGLGGLMQSLDPESTVGRCYLKYVRMFDEVARSRQ